MAADEITKALDELGRARANVKRTTNRQIRGAEDRASLRATAMAWFNSHRPAVLTVVSDETLRNINEAYNTILGGSARNTSKQTYLDAMASAKEALIELRAHVVDVVPPIADTPPDFSPLTTNPEMRAILERRWVECIKCVSVKAHLAAIVMMGGLLEALFVARANQLADKSPLIAAPSAPKDPKTNKVVPLGDWMLKSYLQVGYDLEWITQSQRDLAAVLGEYRNYVHPEKEHRHGVTLGKEDSAILWGVAKSLVHQLLT